VLEALIYVGWMAVVFGLMLAGGWVVIVVATGGEGSPGCGTAALAFWGLYLLSFALGHPGPRTTAP
jgi:hypothetical protein